MTAMAIADPRTDQPPAAAPELGQHTEELLLDLGYTWEQIAALRDAKAI